MKQNSKIIIGCMSWGKWGKNLSIKEQADLIKFCLKNGNSTFDHANIYGDYTTENEFGKALKESGINRKKIQLISKCGIQLVIKNRKNKVKHYNYTKNYIIKSAEKSLKNFKTDYLDMFLLHRPSPLMDVEVISEAILHLKDTGKIKAFGVSNFTATQMELISKYIDISSNQIEISLTEPKTMFDGTLDYMQLNNINALAWSPLINYFKNNNEQNNRIKAVLKELKEKYNVEEDVLLLSWILKHPAKISPIIGSTNKDRILKANKSLKINLELEDWFKLLEASRGFAVA